MKVAVDCRFGTKSPSGVGKFFIDALIAMVNYQPHWHFFLISPHDLEGTLLKSILSCKNVTYIKSNSWRTRSLTFWYNWDYLKESKNVNADLLWTPAPQIPFFTPKGMKNLIIVHDVVEKEFADTQDFKGRWIGNIFKKKAITKSDYIWSISCYTKDKINEYYPDRLKNDIVVGCSCSEIFKKNNISKERCDTIKNQMGIKNRFLLFVGSIEPRKNLQYTLRLMKEYYCRHPDVQLLIVGGRGWKNSYIYDIVNEDDYPKNAVIFANYVDIKLLVELYNIADGFISTSLNEGFGLPQLEAMKCGCPVITANNSAMTEVVSGRGITVDGWNDQDWLAAIDNVLAMQRDKYNPDLSEFDWENIIQRVKSYLDN